MSRTIRLCRFCRRKGQPDSEPGWCDFTFYPRQSNRPPERKHATRDDTLCPECATTLDELLRRIVRPS